ncbi:secreted RxLR effector protein 27-like isoform X1 [Rutidosis leptorrhynchoides]|uniref:secreted RxLR effector protein 27-like isoform X1 n=1 Tax=Rutidosis leptorrhynchoides TaxID=125765 RepID=UPI003A990BAB
MEEGKCDAYTLPQLFQISHLHRHRLIMDGVWLNEKSEKWTNASENPRLWERAHERNAIRIVKLIIELEGMWVKMGQYFSIRVDRLPGAFPHILKQLQDSLSPRSLKEVHRTIQNELGKSMDELFANFVEKPLATTSDLTNAKSVVER